MGDVSVMFQQNRLVQLNHLAGNDLVTSSLEAGNNVANHSSSQAIRLEQNKGPLHEKNQQED